MSTHPLITRVFNDPDMLKNPSITVGKDKEGKPIKKFHIPIEEFYVEGETVYANFMSTPFNFLGQENPAKKMRYKFWFAKYNLDWWFELRGLPKVGEFENLIVGTEFCK